jgi:choline dehydrogenase-like flavoprotein
MLVVALLILAYFALRFLLQSEIRTASATEQEADRKLADRIESLPFTVVVGEFNLLDEARRLYQAGDYARAVVYLFSYELVELDKRHIIRLAKGKTNRQYLREVGPRRSLRQLLEQTMISFEDAFFGRHALEKERFEASWFQVGAFDKLSEEEQKKT